MDESDDKYDQLDYDELCDSYYKDAEEYIKPMVETICLDLSLPMAFVWVTNPEKFSLCCVDWWLNDEGMAEYCFESLEHCLKKGQYVAGKAVNSRKLYSVPNVSLLGSADYPFVNVARKFGLRAAMAIGLKWKFAEKIELVLEFFLPTNLEDTVEQNNLIDEILSSLRKNCEKSETVELLYQEADVEAANFPSAAVSESSLAFPNVGLNLKEKIQNNSLETDESHERVTATECELSEPEKQSDQTPEELVRLRAISQRSSNGGLNSNEKITVETDEPIELEVREQNAVVEHGVEMHDKQQRMSINKRKKTDTQPTKCTPKPRKTTSVVWEFFDKVQENGVVQAKCRCCSTKLCGNSKNGTTSLHKHECFKDWKEVAKQQPVSNVESITKVNSKTKASQTNGADAPPQAKRSKMVAKVGEREEDKERKEETSTDSIVNVMAEVQDPIAPDIGQTADFGLVHEQVQELTIQDDYTSKETPGRGFTDQEHHLLSRRIIELRPTETQSSSRQASNMAIDGTRGLPQVRCTQTELTAEGGIVATSTTSSIPTTTGFPSISATSELMRFLSQSPRVLLSPTEIDRFCSLLNTAINTASNEWQKHPMVELLDEGLRLKEALATCPSSSRGETLPPKGYEDLASTISESAISRSNLEAEITSMKKEAAKLEEQLKAINEQRAHKELELSLLKENMLLCRLMR